MVISASDVSAPPRSAPIRPIDTTTAATQRPTMRQGRAAAARASRSVNPPLMLPLLHVRVAGEQLVLESLQPADPELVRIDAEPEHERPRAPVRGGRRDLAQLGQHARAVVAHAPDDVDELRGLQASGEEELEQAEVAQLIARAGRLRSHSSSARSPVLGEPVERARAPARRRAL